MATNPLPSRQEGTRLFNEGKYDDAAGAYRNATKQDPRDYHSHFYLAICYEAMKSPRQAIGSYKTTLDVMRRTLEGQEDPTFRAKVIDSLTSCIGRSADRNSEIDLLEKCANTTNKAEDFVILAKAHQYSGDADSALAAYTRASRLEPKNFYVLREMGIFLSQIAQNDQAAPLLRRAYVIDPKDPEVNAALRRIGIIPGPSIKNAGELALPPLPKGPLPEPDLSRIGLGPKNPSTPIGSTDTAPITSDNMQTPRD